MVSSQKSVLLALALLPALARGAEDYGQWPRTGDLFLNTTPDGANVAGTVTGFPLLVRLDASVFDFAQARGDGKDIRFSSASGKHLPYQIERWDSAGAKAEIWVLADTVRGNSADQSLRMHWGVPGAADSSRGGAVFDSSNGFVTVLHLASEGGTRANAVGTGLAAVPQNYGSFAPSTGLIGHCDSLRNDGTTQDYLALQDDYSVLAKGFTYSVWANPARITKYARLLDIGTAAGTDNLLLTRVGTTEDLSFTAYNGTTRIGQVIISAGIKQNQWQHFAVTVSGKQIRVYRNGDLVGQDTLTQTLNAERRAKAYIGRSNWSADSFYQGKIDEAIIARKARSADWIRLSYASQKAGQNLMTFVRAGSACLSSFQAPRDTLMAEGGLLELAGRADCATAFSWAAISGMTPRIMDPDVKNLQVFLPRVLQDEVLTYRFTARYGDSVRTKDVRVTVKEAIPDPIWTYDPIPPWNGSDSLTVRARVTNLEAMKGGRDSVVNWMWSVSGLGVDTSWGPGSLVLRNPDGPGVLKVGLCLNNGGAAVCKDVYIDLAGGSAIRARPSMRVVRAPDAEFRDVTGRMRNPMGRAPVLRAFPARQASK